MSSSVDLYSKDLSSLLSIGRVAMIKSDEESLILCKVIISNGKGETFTASGIDPDDAIKRACQRAIELGYELEDSESSGSVATLELRKVISW